MMRNFVLCLIFFISLAECQVTTTPAPISNSDVLGFSNKLYSVLDSKKSAKLADDFQGEYDRLNVDGQLGTKLSAVYEIRLQDLMISIRHAKKMKKVINMLKSP